MNSVTSIHKTIEANTADAPARPQSNATSAIKIRHSKGSLIDNAAGRSVIQALAVILFLACGSWASALA